MGAVYDPMETVQLGELIAAVITKEASWLWLSSDPSTFDLQYVLNVTKASLKATVAVDVANLSMKWIPGLEVSAVTLVDAGNHATPSLPASIHESLWRYFETMAWDELKQSRPAETSEFLKQFKLPAFSIAAITHSVERALAAIAAKQGILAEASAELATSLDTDREKQFRKRIFELEKMATLHSRREKEQVQQERQQREASEARLMEMNCMLEDKLTARAREAQELQERAAAALKASEDMQAEVKKRDDTITTLNYRMEMMAAKLQRVAEKEKEVDKRSLRLSMLEAAVMDQETKRLQELSAVTAGDLGGDALRERLANVVQSQQAGLPAEDDIKASVELLLQRMEGRFQEMFQQRQQKFTEEMARYETSIEERRTEALTLQKELESLRRQIIQTKAAT
mmetsp:Transcript_15689/g.37834  ORF Transcript_15689/g.37834 Transcript_15689/m.37834 type:complete len:400 (-) Transcript_15689:48-1247(-)